MGKVNIRNAWISLFPYWYSTARHNSYRYLVNIHSHWKWLGIMKLADAKRPPSKQGWGVYKIRNSYFCLPPFLNYILYKMYYEGMRAAGENLSAFFLIQPMIFCNFGCLKSIRETICISPLFFVPLNNIFSPTWYLAMFLPPPQKNKKINTPAGQLTSAL